ncbi:MAG: 50S ribosomal protein L5 [Candidatus Pacebacteria bacterium]|nr:50S ribosomal protein L5 [Candidatus Paceibacterota bacterium]
METTKEKLQKAFDNLKKDFGYTNKFATPKIVKVVVNSSTGSTKDKKKIELVQDRMAKIVGQKVAPRAAKKSIATFKLREGDIIGYSATLRGARMTNFLDKLINIAIPRTRDFQGIERSSIDEMGNLTIGIKEHTIFPETADEDLKDVFGLSITVVTTAKTPKEAEGLLDHVGIPFVKKKD